MWKQIPFATKLYFLILIGLIFLLFMLIVIRADLISRSMGAIKSASIESIIRLFRRPDVTIPFPAPDSPHVVSTEPVEIREGPGESYPIIGEIPANQQAEVTGASEDGLWWSIKISGKGFQTGWIPTHGVEAMNAESVPRVDPEGAPLLNSLLDTPQLTALETTKILFGPGPDYGTVGYLESGQTAEIIGKDQAGLWWIIRVPFVDGGQGWVVSDDVIARYVEAIAVLSPPSELFSIATPSQDGVLVTAIANVNVRDGPGLGYNKVSVLANGQSAEVIGVSPDGLWWMIRLPESPTGQGWISVDYVLPLEIDNIPVIDLSTLNGSMVIPTPEDRRPSITALTMVNIRSGPGLQYPILGRLEPGQRAEVIGITADKSWWVIKLVVKGNDRGWVAVNYVQPQNTEGVPVID